MMKESSASIIDHIPQFLIYCKERAYSRNTQSNYKRYLDKFLYWLKAAKKTGLKPHELTSEDIWDYRLYLSRSQGQKGAPLKKSTQNYYLIALRAILGYFVAKDIVSLLPDKITLSRLDRSWKIPKLLNSSQIAELLASPDIKTTAGLRDKAILETIVCSGLKVNQIARLNRGQLDEIPEPALSCVKKYLKTRSNESGALFINYKANNKKSIEGRLTPRSIERTINHYGVKTGIPFSITPEILRWARPRALFNEKIEILSLDAHKTFVIRNYDYESIDNKQNLVAPETTDWKTVEKLIDEEISWLKNNIPTMPERYKINPPFSKCDDCILRKIAILIISGKVNARELSASDGKILWGNSTRNNILPEINRHGQEWHRKMMDVIHEYFKTLGCMVDIEPPLNYGRADLKVSLKQKRNIYIEVDTVSLFKLWYNFSTIKNATFLIIPSENKIIEFNIK